MDLTKPKLSNTDRELMLYRSARGVAIVSAIFSLVIVILLAASWLRVKDVPPADSKAVAALIEAVKNSSGDAALIGEVRDLDLLARQAQFHWWQFSRTGAWLLVAGIAIFASSLKIMSGVRLQVSVVGEKPVVPEASISRWAVVCFGVVILGLCGVLWRGSGPVVLPTATVEAAGGEEEAEDEPVQAALPAIDEAMFSKNWPGFRGYLGAARQDGVKPPTSWDGEAGTNIIWKSPVPAGSFNSQIVWEGRIFLTHATSEERVVICLDAASGQELWKQFPAALGPKKEMDISEDTGYAASTMATDGHRVFAVFATGDLVAYDLDGKQVWAKNLHIPEVGYGYASSLFCYKNKLVIQMDASEGGKVLALDTATGNEVWTTLRDMEDTWATPVICENGNQPILILNGNPEVRGYDVETGKQLWAWDGMGGEVATSPAVSGTSVFVGQEYAQLAGLNAVTGEQLWTSDEYDLSDVTSPVATDDLVFVPSSSGVVTCVDAKTGAKHWIKEYEESFYSSPVVVDGKVFLMDRKGVMQIFAADKTFSQIGSPKLGESSVCTPAFVGNRIYIRAKSHVYCIGAAE